MIDIRDSVLQATCPVVSAPRFGPLPSMANGQRIIVASNGLFVQVKLDWLDCTQRLCVDTPAMRLPYGDVQEQLVFSFGVLPLRLMEAFIEVGRKRLPNEVASVLIYSRHQKTLRLALCEPIEVSPVRIHYSTPPMADDEMVAVDLHTHGQGAAFWSAQDDRDDQGIKIAGVFGHLHQPKICAEFRLALNGMFKPLPHPWQSGTAVPAIKEDHDIEPSLLRRVLRRWHIGGNSSWNI